MQQSFSTFSERMAGVTDGGNERTYSACFQIPALAQLLSACPLRTQRLRNAMVTRTKGHMLQCHVRRPRQRRRR